MQLKLIIPVILFTACVSMSAQSLIGLPKEEVKVLLKKEHKEFRRDNSVVKQQFNYLKYVNGIRTRTWILYFTDEDICKTSKLVCDYDEYDKVLEDLTSSYEKLGDSVWEYMLEDDTIHITLVKLEWYFTVRESRKK
jgi:hypothetical protein